MKPADNGPKIRTIYQFNCSACDNEESVRWPYNPLQETPDVQQSIPNGWSLILLGDSLQTPVPLCDECTKQDTVDPKLN